MKMTRSRGPIASLPLFFCLLLLSAGCESGSSSDVSVARQEFSIVRAVADQVLLTLEGINGNIIVTGVSGGDSLYVEGVREVWADTQQEADLYLDSLEVQLNEGPDYFVVFTDQPAEVGGRHFVVDYEIRLPDDLALEIDNANGEVTMSSISNNVDIENTNGDIRLTGILGSLSVEAAHSIVDAEVTLPLDGTVSVVVDNGQIVLSIPQNTSAQFSAQAPNGDIDLVNLNLQDVILDANSISGTLGGGRGSISLILMNGLITVVGI